MYDDNRSEHRALITAIFGADTKKGCCIAFMMHRILRPCNDVGRKELDLFICSLARMKRIKAVRGQKIGCVVCFHRTNRPLASSS